MGRKGEGRRGEGEKGKGGEDMGGEDKGQHFSSRNWHLAYTAMSIVVRRQRN